MGQCYKAVNLDKKEAIRTYYYEQGAKLMEFSWQGNNFMLAVDHMMRTRWEGDRVLFIGDYTATYMTEQYWNANSPFLLDLKEEFGAEDLYGINWKIINPLPSKKQSRYLCNDVKKEYIDLKSQPIHWYFEKDGELIFAKIHPLSLMLCTSNGLGGGDFVGLNEKHVGEWVSCCYGIHLSDEQPEGYRKSPLFFSEEDNDYAAEYKATSLVDCVNTQIIKSVVKDNPTKNVHEEGLYLNESEREEIGLTINGRLMNRIKEELKTEEQKLLRSKKSDLIYANRDFLLMWDIATHFPYGTIPSEEKQRLLGSESILKTLTEEYRKEHNVEKWLKDRYPKNESPSSV